MIRLAAAVGMILIAQGASAQNVPWARSAGMAGADFALVRGYSAVEWNPANIFVEEEVGLSFGSAVHGGRLLVTGASVFDLADIIRSAGGGDPSLLDRVPAEGLRLDAVSEGLTASKLADILGVPDPSGSVDVPSFGLSYRNGGLVFRQQTVLSALVSRELVDLAVNGFKPEQISDYAARNTRLRSFTISTVTLGLSKSFGRLSGGVAVRYLLGQKLVTGRVFEPAIDVDAETLTAAATSIESRGAKGGGIDVGLTYRLGASGFASLAIQNVWQRTYWSDALFASQSTLTQDDLGGSDLRNLIDRFRARELDPGATTLEAYTTSQDLFDESFLPRVVRAGVGWKLPTNTEVQLVGSKRFGPGNLMPPQLDRVAAGVQQTLGVLRLRAGLALEENSTQQLSGGVGFRFGGMSIDTAGGWTSGRGEQASIVHGFSAAIGFGFSFDNWDPR